MPAATPDRDEPRFEPRHPGARARSGDPRRREAEPPAPARASDAELLAAIGRDLEALYAEVLRQPLPRRLAALIQHIEENHHATRSTRGRGRVAGRGRSTDQAS
jgi:hypothetical protein